MDRVVDILASIRKKGVSLWSANGQLHFKGPKGALTREEIEALRLSKTQIVALLECAVSAEIAKPKLKTRPQPGRAPLALSQLGRWRLCHLYERTTIRQVAEAMRMHGRLNINALQRSVTEIVRRHEALRTRILVCDGIPTQDVAEVCEYELQVSDLAALPDHSREAEVQSSIERLILEPIEVCVGPLFAIRLLRLREDEHVLAVAMEHIISDGFSMGILWRELLAAYTQAVQGRDFSLPAIPIQFADYATWQRGAQDSWFETHGVFWNKHLAGCQRLSFPEDKLFKATTRQGWGAVEFKIGDELKHALRDWCRLRRTTLAMAIFTAYAGMVLRWCNVSDGVFQYPIDARVSPAIANTIGFFASMLYLRVKSLEDDSFINLLNRLTQEYCDVYEHADPHDLSARIPAPDFTRTALFNWVTRPSSRMGLSEHGGPESAIRCTPVSFPHPFRKNLESDSEPAILLVDTDGGEISGEVSFPLNRFSVETMERFARNILVFVCALLRKPDGRLKDVLLV